MEALPLRLVTAAMLLILARVVQQDLTRRRVPNAAVLGLILLGLLHSALRGTLPSALAGCVVNAVVFLPPTTAGAAGPGDLKLAAACGLALGFPGALWGVMAGSLLSIPHALIVAWKEKSLRARFPYGTYLALGFAAMLVTTTLRG